MLKLMGDLIWASFTLSPGAFTTVKKLEYCVGEVNEKTGFQFW